MAIEAANVEWDTTPQIDTANISWDEPVAEQKKKVYTSADIPNEFATDIQPKQQQNIQEPTFGQQLQSVAVGTGAGVLRTINLVPALVDAATNVAGFSVFKPLGLGEPTEKAIAGLASELRPMDKPLPSETAAEWAFGGGLLSKFAQGTKAAAYFMSPTKEAVLGGAGGYTFEKVRGTVGDYTQGLTDNKLANIAMVDAPAFAASMATMLALSRPTRAGTVSSYTSLNVLPTQAETALADELRKNPLAVQEIQNNLKILENAGIDATLAEAGKQNPMIARLHEDLFKIHPDYAARYTELEGRATNAHKNFVDALVDGALDSKDVAKAYQNELDSIMSEMAVLEKQLPTPVGADTKGLSKEFWEAKVQPVIDKRFEDIGLKYDRLTPSEKFSKKEVVDVVKRAIKTVQNTTEGVINEKGSGVNDLFDALRNYQARKLRTGGGTNAFAPASMGDVYEFLKYAKNIARKDKGSNVFMNNVVKELEGWMTTQGALSPEIKALNTEYRAMKEVSDRETFRTFVEKATGNPAASSEGLFQKFVAGSPKQALEDWQKLEKVYGIPKQTSRDAFENMMLAHVTDAEGKIIPSRLKSFLGDNSPYKQMVDYFDMRGPLSTYESALNHVAGLVKQEKELGNNLVLSKLNGSLRDRQTVISAIQDGSFKKLFNNLPPSQIPAARKMAQKHILFDENGSMTDPIKMQGLLREAGMEIGHINTLAALSTLMKKAAEKGALPEGIPASIMKNELPFTQTVVRAFFDRISSTTNKIGRISIKGHTLAERRLVRRQLSEALLTPDGAARVLDLVKKSPTDRFLVQQIVMGKSALYPAVYSREEQQ